MRNVKENNKRYKRTVNGLIRTIYEGQIRRSIKRKMDLPNFTLDELYTWITNNDTFIDLYVNWCESNYLKILKPSCDRIDDYKPYTFDNMRLVTWEENHKKSISDIKNGINNKKSTPVMCIETGIIYPSAQYAGRSLGFNGGDIAKVFSVNHSNKTAGGFHWKHIYPELPRTDKEIYEEVCSRG